MSKLLTASAAIAVSLCGSPLFAQNYYGRSHIQTPRATTPTAPQTPVTHSWSEGDWSKWSSECSSTSTRSRSVTCVSSRAETVADTFCRAPKPTASETQEIRTQCTNLIVNGGFEEAGGDPWQTHRDIHTTTEKNAIKTGSRGFYINGGYNANQIVAGLVPGTTYILSYNVNTLPGYTTTVTVSARNRFSNRRNLVPPTRYTHTPGMRAVSLEWTPQGDENAINFYFSGVGYLDDVVILPK